MNVDRILWLVSDTVRADYVGYGGGHVHTPNLDALAVQVSSRQGVSSGSVSVRLSCVQVSGVRCQVSGVRRRWRSSTTDT